MSDTTLQCQTTGRMADSLRTNDRYVASPISGKTDQTPLARPGRHSAFMVLVRMHSARFGIPLH